ncbi:hypothetical protein GCM10010429_25320 [Micromonospora olivasterospora]
MQGCEGEEHRQDHEDDRREQHGPGHRGMPDDRTVPTAIPTDHEDNDERRPLRRPGQCQERDSAGRPKLRPMAKYLDVHPDNPQHRTISQVVDLIRRDGLIAYPTDSCFALGCRLGNKEGMDRIREIRNLDSGHHFTVVCRDFAQLGQFVQLSNAVFRAVKAATPGSYTFILPATKEVPRRLLHPKKKTVGVRIPEHPVAQAILTELGEPLLSSTLLLPGDEEPMTQGWEIKERLDHAIDAVVDSGECGTEPTTVVDFSEGEPEIVRVGAGDPSRFA